MMEIHDLLGGVPLATIIDHYHGVLIIENTLLRSVVPFIGDCYIVTVHIQADMYVHK